MGLLRQQLSYIKAIVSALETIQAVNCGRFWFRNKRYVTPPCYLRSLESVILCSVAPSL